jgi:hypothetical protein
MLLFIHHVDPAADPIFACPYQTHSDGAGDCRLVDGLIATISGSPLIRAPLTTRALVAFEGTSRDDLGVSLGVSF